ncbi:MAG: phage tail tube protein [Haloferacaceae archaeon]|nr:phage tail tube protein [Haloferacaceae archaeon]
MDSNPATYDQAGFEGLTYSLIGEVTDLGEFGREYSAVTHNPLGDRRTVKRKGSYNDGTVAMTVARVPGDAGQTLLTTGLDSDDSYSFEVVLQDGTTLYFEAQIMSYTTNVGSVDQITTASVSLEITNDIIEVAAA